MRKSVTWRNRIMVRTYSVKYKSKSKMLTDVEKVEAAKKEIGRAHV